MSKRLTGTNKWDQAWFRKLSPTMKCVWMFMLDRCDHAGILEIDFESMSFFVGENIDEEQFLNIFSDKIKQISSSKIFITDFIEFQYGVLNPDNRVHKSVISRLEKLGSFKGLKNPLLGDKDKEKDNKKDNKKDKNNNKEKEEKKNFKKEIEQVYLDHYPLKEGKTKGVEKLETQIKSEEDLQKLITAISNYKKTIKDPKYIKHFSTFVNHPWTDYLDQNHGSVEKIKPTSHDVSHVWDDK